MLDYTLFGESHGPVVGVLLTNVPAGWTVDEKCIAAQLLRRSGGQELTTARREKDAVEYLSGVYEGHTTGEPLVAVIRNENVQSGDYRSLQNTPRPGHADYSQWVKSAGFSDLRGGGHHSGRMTAPLVVAGSIAQSHLLEKGITVEATIVEEEELRRRAAAARAEGDSVGGRIRCTVRGLPAGLGGADWAQAVESEIARHIFAIPAVKAVGFGEGEGFAGLRGSEANDPLRTDGKRVFTATNRAGGVNGGITNGMDITFTVTFRPTPSIAKEQQTVDLATMENTTVTVRGRHDPCVVLRAAPAVEAAAALAVVRLLPPEETLDSYRRELDAIDRDLVGLFVQRMEVAKAIGAEKRKKGLPVQDAEREKAVLQSRGDWAPEYRRQISALYETVMALSREEQA